MSFFLPTYQFLSCFLREQPLQHVHAEGSVSGYVLCVHGLNKLETMVVIGTPATKPKIISTQNTQENTISFYLFIL